MMSWTNNRGIRVLGFFATEMDFSREICAATDERTRQEFAVGMFVGFQ